MAENPPAFPETREHISESKPGMTLRDWFAGQALAQATREIWGHHKYEDVAKRAYGIADAMLEARDRIRGGWGMSGHTKGPWSYRPMEHDDWGIVRAPNEQGQFAGGIICQAYDPDARDELTLAAHRVAGTDPWEANARLIAAAPELLEALLTVGRIVLEQRCERGTPWDRACTTIAEKVRQHVAPAIAKATGDA